MKLTSQTSSAISQSTRTDSTSGHVCDTISQIYAVSMSRNEAISGNASLKMMRVIQDIQENIESLNGIKIHGAPVSLRAYLLISLCNLQDLVEEPFDQMGLDDIKLDEFEFLEPGPREHAVPVNA